MQVSGKLLVITTFAIGLFMAMGSWWYNYQQSRLAAQFWGAEAATLLVGSEKVELLQLSDPAAESSADANPADPQKLVAGRAVTSAFDLTAKRGLVHLRHALTYDDNFDWNHDRKEPLATDNEWAHALRFTRGPSELVVLFTADFQKLGKFRATNDPPGEVETLPCEHLGPVIIDYLRQPDVGALPPAPAK